MKINRTDFPSLEWRGNNEYVEDSYGESYFRCNHGEKIFVYVEEITKEDKLERSENARTTIKTNRYALNYVFVVTSSPIMRGAIYEAHIEDSNKWYSIDIDPEKGCCGESRALEDFMNNIGKLSLKELQKNWVAQFKNLLGQ